MRVVAELVDGCQCYSWRLVIRHPSNDSEMNHDETAEANYRKDQLSRKQAVRTRAVTKSGDFETVQALGGGQMANHRLGFVQSGSRTAGKTSRPKDNLGNAKSQASGRHRGDGKVRFDRE